MYPLGSSQCPLGSSQRPLGPPSAPGSITAAPPVSPSHVPPPEAPLGEDDEDKDLEVVTVTSPKSGGQSGPPSDTDITAEFLQPLLTPENVANLVGGVMGGRGGSWGGV